MEKENRPLGWTTIEEAQQLVKAGLDPNTADMYYEPNDDGEYCIYPHSQCNSYRNYDEYKEQWPDIEIIPCWSAGVLISVMPKNIDKYNLCITFEKGCPMVYYIDINGSLLKLGDTYPYYRTDGYIVCDSIVEMCVWLLENGYIEKHE